MPGIIALVLVAVVALIVLGFAVHLLFSPWLLVAVAILPGSSSGRAAPASSERAPAVTPLRFTREKSSTGRVAAYASYMSAKLSVAVTLGPGRG